MWLKRECSSQAAIANKRFSSCYKLARHWRQKALNVLSAIFSDRNWDWLWWLFNFGDNFFDCKSLDVLIFPLYIFMEKKVLHFQPFLPFMEYQSNLVQSCQQPMTFLYFFFLSFFLSFYIRCPIQHMTYNVYKPPTSPPHNPCPTSRFFQHKIFKSSKFYNACS